MKKYLIEFVTRAIDQPITQAAVEIWAIDPENAGRACKLMFRNTWIEVIQVGEAV